MVYNDVIDYTVHKGPIYDLLDDVTVFCFLVDNLATGKWQLTLKMTLDRQRC